MQLGKVFGTNKEKEEQGVWQDGPDGARFLIARSNNKKFAKLSADLLKPHRKLIRMGKMDDKLLTKISAEICARTVLLDWSGVKDKDGNDLEYSPEAAAAALIEFPDFADFITGLSQEVTAYQDEEKEEAVKN